VSKGWCFGNVDESPKPVTFDPYDYRHLRGIAQSPDVTIVNLRKKLYEAREENKALQAELDILRASQGNQTPSGEDRAMTKDYDPIREGQLALERARWSACTVMPVFAKCGIVLDLPPNVPKFHADSEGRIIQVLNGVSSYVKIVDGEVVVVDQKEEE